MSNLEVLHKCKSCQGRGQWPDDGTEQTSTERSRVKYQDGPYMMSCNPCHGTGFTSNGLRAGKNSQKYAPGFGFCGSCKTPWAFVNGHDTRYKYGTSMFPLCEACFEEKTPEERLPYYEELVEDWKRYSPDDNGTPWAETEAAIIRAVLEGK